MGVDLHPKQGITDMSPMRWHGALSMLHRSVCRLLLPTE